MANYPLIPCDRLFARLEDELSSFQANNILDTGKLYTQVKWFSQQLGLAVTPFEETVLKLDKNKGELPCNFYLLDSAWLCDASPSSEVSLNFQASIVAYLEHDCEEVVNNCTNCSPDPSGTGINPPCISACNMDTTLTKKTVREYILSSPNDVITWRNPVLLKLVPHKKVQSFCDSKCANIFSNSPDEISIEKQGDSYFLTSNLKNAVIYVKYYAFPKDKETGLPLIPDDSVIEEGLFYHLVAYFLQMAWLNGQVTDIENKLKYFKELARVKFIEARNYTVLPSFNKMVQLGRRSRTKFDSYEVMNRWHT